MRRRRIDDMTRTHVALSVVVAVVFAASPRAQSPLAFEVASINQNESGALRVTPPD